MENKFIYTVGITNNLTSEYSASEIIKILNKLSNGRGGGRSDFAQGGGEVIISQSEIINKIELFIEKKLNL